MKNKKRAISLLILTLGMLFLSLNSNIILKSTEEISFNDNITDDDEQNRVLDESPITSDYSPSLQTSGGTIDLSLHQSYLNDSYDTLNFDSA